MVTPGTYSHWTAWEGFKIWETLMLTQEEAELFLLHPLTKMCSCWLGRTSNDWHVEWQTVWQHRVCERPSSLRALHSCTLPVWLYQTQWHGFNSNADLMGHNQRCLLTGVSETNAIAHKLRHCNTNRLKLYGIWKGNSLIHSTLLPLQHQQLIWCGNMS